MLDIPSHKPVLAPVPGDGVRGVLYAELIGEPHRQEIGLDGKLEIQVAPDVSERLTAQGYQTVGNTPQEFAQLINTEIARWKTVVKSAGIKPIEQ